MNTAKIVRASLLRVKVAVVWGMIACALTSAVPMQGMAAEPPPAGPTCSAPANEAERAQCAMLERQILDATVFLRFTLHCGPSGDQSAVALVPSHATILDSHTLLTHDHYFPLSDPTCVVTSLEVATALGEPLAELEDAVVLGDVARQLRSDPPGGGNQTRVVRFLTPLFTPVPDLTFETADRAVSSATFLYSGELAEINWESFPRATRVEWVRPVALERRGAALGLVVNRSVEIGASGGGAFRVTPTGLVHIGNIWGTWRDDDTSIVALNLAGVLK